MRQLLDEFIFYLHTVKKCSDNTTASYKRDLQKMLEYMENRGVTAVEDMTQDRLFAYMASLNEEHLSSNTIIRHNSSIKAFFRYLLENGNITENPAEKLRAPRAVKNQPRVLSAYEVDNLLSQSFSDDYKGKRDKALLEIMYATGLKASEIVELKLSNIDMSLNCIRLSEDRVVPYGKKAREALDDYLLHARQELISDNEASRDRVFVNYKGEPMSRQGLWKLIKTYADRAGIDKDITSYTLRHSFAVHLLETGADTLAVKEMMGFTDEATLAKYSSKKGLSKDPYEWARIRN
ncbi:tyrosine-type recombinase/integrase [Butyrivibrio sp. INlla14]|uniref:tyrosine-type recombinase/integrase n=1 Tax=Butyrivibrio sp. INlla14 TaxID=1520808 RepID=UPI0008764ED1|nr:tyrosine-type recombinase/integrase [Butyrivibrio sp. INlla14]SCY32145.1 integrase/recombinase XerD [Butyrivibrio sp. INlla14]